MIPSDTRNWTIGPQPARIVLAICILLSTSLHLWFLALPGFEDDLRWQIHWGRRVAKEGLWKLYDGDYSNRNGRFNHHDIVDYPPVVPLIMGGLVASAKALHQREHLYGIVKFTVTVFEVALITLLFCLVMNQSRAPEWRRLLVGGLILLNPGLALSTTGWGQIDSLLCLSIVLAFYFGWRDRFWLSTPLIFAAVLTKPQGVIALGCYFVMLLSRRKYKAFWVQGACGLALLLSLTVAFRFFSHSNFLDMYFGAVGAFPATSWTAFNFWELIFGDESLHVRDTARLLGVSYHAIGLALFFAALFLAVRWFWKCAQTFEDFLLFGGLVFLGFFLFPTEMHGRFLYYPVVLLALPAARSNLLLGAYLSLSTILYFNVKFSMERFAPGMYAEFVMPESMSNAHRVVSLVALAAGAIFFAEVLRRRGAPSLSEVAQPNSASLDDLLDRRGS
jgi:Gpi18-like mannosyltransferase